jgi:dihydroorotase
MSAGPGQGLGLQRILVSGGQLLDPASGFEGRAIVAIADGRILSIGAAAPPGFAPDLVIDASGCLVAPGLVDLNARLGEPGHEHEQMLESETAAAVAGGVTSVVCPPDTDPVLDEPGLVRMLKFRATSLRRCRVFPLGALTHGLKGESLTEMVELTQAGCVGFGQADAALGDTQVLLRALQYAATFGYPVWLRPEDLYLGHGVAASGPLATRLGLSGVPVAAETIALHTIFELVRSSGARVHLCRLSSADGVALVRAAKAQALAVSCDVSVNSLHLTDADVGYFDSRARLRPPLRQQRDRDALGQGLLDGTIDCVVSDHSPVGADEKNLPFAEATPGATGLELLLGLVFKWSRAQPSDDGLSPWMRTLRLLTSQPAAVLCAQAGEHADGVGRLLVGQAADLCVIDPAALWTVAASALQSQGKHTPFGGQELVGRVRWTLVGGHIAYQHKAD